MLVMNNYLIGLHVVMCSSAMNDCGSDSHDLHCPSC